MINIKSLLNHQREGRKRQGAGGRNTKSLSKHLIMKFYRSIYMRSFKRDFPVVYEVFASGYQRFKQAQLELKARIKQKEGKES